MKVRLLGFLVATIAADQLGWLVSLLALIVMWIVIFGAKRECRRYRKRIDQLTIALTEAQTKPRRLESLLVETEQVWARERDRLEEEVSEQIGKLLPGIAMIHDVVVGDTTPAAYVAGLPDVVE